MRKPNAGLWRKNPETPEGKYLVKRRDGSVVDWPNFVLGAKDPAAPDVGGQGSTGGNQMRLKVFDDFGFTKLQGYISNKDAEVEITHPPAFMQLQDPDGCQYMRGQHVIAVIVKFVEGTE
ncbi:MAG TPA: hypothetical protein VNH83_28225 [Bryobacteraceae bacterium]|nr:hypothetical protein [Bryobacteraceae bacterium]